MKTRRKFLTDAGKCTLALTAFDTLFGSMLKSRAFAATSGNFKNFLHINLYGSPPRWHYDLILNPNNKANEFMRNKQVSNYFTGNENRYDDTSYRLVNYDNKGIWVPHILGQTVNLGDGRAVRGWDILDHMINIRGIDILNAAHVGANQLHQAAASGAATTASMTADRAAMSSSNPVQNVIRAATLNPSPGSIFRSRDGHGQFRYDVRPGINNLVNIFNSLRPITAAQGFNGVFVNNLGHLEDKLMAAMNSLDPAANRYYKNVLENNDGALKILTDDSIAVFQELSGDWDHVYNRYKQVADSAMSKVVPGINDKRIGVPLTAANEHHYGFVQNITVDVKTPGGVPDLRLMLAEATLDHLASQFAVIEFMMLRNICPSIAVTPIPFINVDYGAGNTLMPFDQHFMGHMTGVFMNSMYWMCFNALLLELIRNLKIANLFEDTLIYMAGEFNRSPVDSGPDAGRGSDHGSKAGSISLISGRIPAFKLIGNVYTNAAGAGTETDSKYKGSWGHCAPIGGKDLNIIQVWGSIMALLGMPVPDIPNTVNKDRMIFKTPGNVTPLAPFNTFKNINNG